MLLSYREGKCQECLAADKWKRSLYCSKKYSIRFRQASVVYRDFETRGEERYKPFQGLNISDPIYLGFLENILFWYVGMQGLVEFRYTFLVWGFRFIKNVDYFVIIKP